MSKLTSVEWLVEQLWKHCEPSLTNKILIEQAKEMHKQEIIDAYFQCGKDNFEHIKVINRSATEYYNETYQSVDTNEMINHIGDTDEMVDVPKQNDVREDDVDKLDNRKDKLEILAKLLAKSWFYCDWRWENPNERVMQMLMQDLGLYPFKDEDEMIQQTKIDEGLDKQLYKEASMRIPTYGKLSEDIVESKIENNVEKFDFENELEKLINTHSIDNDIETPDFVLSSFLYSCLQSFKYAVKRRELLKAKENTYTEEQVREAIQKARHSYAISHDIIQSLKQHKL